MEMGTRHRKIRKLRGSRSHGWGQVKGHRSHPGGRGNAGLMKYKWSWTVKYDPDHFTKPSLNPPNRKIVKKWINVGDLDGLFLHSKSNTPIDLEKLGYQKLLGSGSVQGSYELLVTSFTKQAQSKIKKAGGKISPRS